MNRRLGVMARWLAVLAIVAALGSGLFDRQARAQETTDAPPEGGPVVVVLNNQASFRGASVADQVGVDPTQTYDTIFNGFAADLTGEQIAELSENPQVAAIVPDIPFYGDADYPPSIARAGLQDEVAGGSGASIAIIDSGIAPHSALNIVGGVDCMSSGGYFDTAGHGTHVAGIAAASGGSSIGSAPGASLYAVKVLDGAPGANPSGSLSTVLCGLNWVAANAGSINAANMSLSASGSGASACGDPSDPLHNAVCAVVGAGVPIVAAAGNSNASGGYIPAAYPEVIGVASLTDYNGMPGGGASRPSYCPGSNDGADDTISNFSNYGGLAELAAPGTCILSTYPGGGYAYMSGTSMAAPLVTGVVANHGTGWLFSVGTKAQSSAAGYTGAKSAGPVLYASDVIVTPTPVVTPSPTTSITPTLGPCPTASSTTATAGVTVTAAVTATPCATLPVTPTTTATTTSTPTSTATSTTTATSTATATGTSTVTATATATTTGTSTPTGTLAPSATATRTPTVPTATATATSTTAPTATATRTSTTAPTATATRTLVPTIAPTANPGSGRISGTGGDGVNCRLGPGTGYGVIVVLPEGATVPLNGPAANGWQPVICGGRAGYVLAQYVTIVTPPSTPTPVSTPTRTPTPGPSATPTKTLVPSVTPTRTATGVSTPTRTPAPTLVPTANPGTGRISGTGGGGLNCRSGPGTGYPVIVVLAEGATVPLRGPASGGWQPVICGGQAGWVSAEYITVVTPPSTPTPASTATPTRTPGPSPTPTRTLVPSITPTQTATGIATPTRTPAPTTIPTVNPGSGRISGTGGGGVNCRTGPGTGYDVITVIPEGAVVPLRGPASGGWQPVTCGGQAGWVSAQYVTIVTPAPTATPPGPTPTRTPTLPVTITPTTTPSSGGTGRITGTGGIGVNCRSGAGTGYVPITVLQEGATVPLRGPASGGWQPVTCAGQAGWVSAQYVTIISGAGSGAATVVPTATSMATQTATTTSTPLPTETPTATVTVASTETPLPTETATSTPTEMPLPSETPTTEPTETSIPTATAPANPTEPVDVGLVMTVSGTDGEGVFCRDAPSGDGTPLLTVPEGATVPVTGEAIDGWVPVLCADGIPGYVSATYLVVSATGADGSTPSPVVTEDVVATEVVTQEIEASVEASVVAEETTETPEATETPLPIIGIGDSEQSGAAFSAIDNDPGTSWTVWPSLSPTRVELTIDLGQSQPIDRLTLETDAWGTLPGTEVWLSDDGVTWWNVTWIDGGSIAPDTVTTVPLGYWARFVKLVVPHADQTGLASFGGIRQLDLWATVSGDALPLSAAGAPTTPEPEPTQPVDTAPVETQAPVETVPVEVLPTETPPPVETEVPVETVPVEGSPEA